MRRMTYGGSDYQATYDGGGDRVTSLLGGVTTTYHMGAGLLQSTTSAGGSTVYTPGISQRKNGVDSYFHDDWIGSTRFLTDSTGNGVPTTYGFDAYGVQRSGSAPGATTVRFAGGHGYEDDGPNGTMLLGARYYAPGLGRFLSPDPIGHAGGLNLYGYVGNDPVNGVDPSGLIGGPIGAQERQGIADANAMFGRWLGRNWGHLARGTLSIFDPGIGDAYEASTGDELFSTGRLSTKQRSLTALAIIIPVVPTPLIRGARSLGRASRAGCEAAQAFLGARAGRAGVRYFPTSRAMKKGLGDPGPGRIWHHIVEQRLDSHFGGPLVHNSVNAVSVPKWVNQEIANYYSRGRHFTNGKTVRDWLGSQSYEKQFEFGSMIMNRVSHGLPLP